MAEGHFGESEAKRLPTPFTSSCLGVWKRARKSCLRNSRATGLLQQNAAMWAFLSELATEFEARGITLADAQTVISTRIEVPWDKNIVKVNCWNPIQRVIADKKSSTTLDKDELRTIAESVQRFAADNFDIHVPFGID